MPHRLTDELLLVYVDDEPSNLKVFEANFKGQFRLATCSSGAEALALLKARGHEVGIVVTDQRMPGMTGVELLEKVRVLVPDAQRMLLTAFADMDVVVNAVNRGQIARYFVKPWNVEELTLAFVEAMRTVKVQSQLRQIELRLLQSERVAAVSQATAGMAHELSKPIAELTDKVAGVRAQLDVVRQFVQSASAHQPDSAIQKVLSAIPGSLEDLEIGAKQIRTIAATVHAKTKGDEPEDTSDLSQVVYFALKLASAELRTRANSTVNGLPVLVRGGPVTLTRVLLNLIISAARSIDGVRRVSGNVEVEWKESGSDVLLSVRDDGPGLAPDVLDRIFEPSVTAGNSGVHGAGLNVSRELVQSVGGKLWLTSELNVGTTAWVRLPKA